MKRAGSTRRNLVSWTTARLAYAASQWGVLAIIARLGSPTDVGAYGLAVALSAPFVVCANLNMRFLQSTDTQGEFSFGQYLGFRVVAQAIALICIVTAAFVSARATLVIIALVAAAKVAESLIELTQGYFHLHQRSDIAARSLILKGILTVMSLTAGLYFGGLPLGVTSVALVWAGVAAFNLMRVRGMEVHRLASSLTFVPDFSPHAMKRLCMVGLPLGITAALSSLRTNVPRYFVELHFGLESLGYFTALSYLLVAANVVMQAVGQVMAPHMARLISNRKESDAKKLTLKLFAMGGSMGVAFIVLAKWLGAGFLKLAYGHEYSHLGNELVWVSFASVFTFIHIVGIAAVSAARAFRVQPFIALAGCLTALCTSYLTIKPLGLLGATLALAAGPAAEAFLYGAICLGITPVKIFRGETAKPQAT